MKPPPFHAGVVSLRACHVFSFSFSLASWGRGNEGRAFHFKKKRKASPNSLQPLFECARHDFFAVNSAHGVCPSKKGLREIFETKADLTAAPQTHTRKNQRHLKEKVIKKKERMSDLAAENKRESDAAQGCCAMNDILPCGGLRRLSYHMTAADLPLDVLALILGQALDAQWLFCARAVCRLWASVCITIQPRHVVRASCAASLLAAAPDDDPYIAQPEAAERWCLSMSASLTDAGAVLVASGRRRLIDYAIARPRAHDVVSTTMIPFESLTVGVVRLCEPEDVEAYLNTHPLAVIPDRAVDALVNKSFATDDDKRDDDADNKDSGLYERERRRETLLMLYEHYMLRFASVRGFDDIKWPDQAPGRVQTIYSIARYMAHDPKLARNVLRDYGRHQKGHMTADEALFLLARMGQLNGCYWAKQFEALIVEALGDTVLDPRTVVDLLARSKPAMRDRPFETPLLVRLYMESPLLAPLRPLSGIDADNCPLLDPDARVDMDMDIALLQLASASPDTVMAHAAIDMAVSRGLTNAHCLMCPASDANDRDDEHTLWTLALRARSAYKAADAAGERTDTRPRHGACNAKGGCAVLAEARIHAREHGFMGEMWTGLFDLGVDNSPQP
nr:F-box incomplete domain containing protein [Pandoravirus aubagnensis]